MNRFYLFLSTLIFLFSLHLSFILPRAYAAKNFSTNLAGIYTVDENATTHADLTVSLTNITSQWYASSYSFQVGFKSVSNVKAYDATGTITPKVSKTDAGTLISINFNDTVVGLNKRNVFHVSFDTTDIAQKSGQIWEINIPGVANQDDFSDFNVEVKVPKKFGKPTYIKPDQGNNSLVFNKEQLGKSGISLSFGDTQYYAYNLTYHLKNSNVFPIPATITLPPTTNYQEVILDSLTPKPIIVTKDVDGNWVASYQLLPSQKLSVVAKIAVSLSPKSETLSEKDKSLYLAEQPYWTISNPRIKKLAQELKTPAAIYEYVVKTLSYDFSRVTDNKPRLGGVNVLSTPNSAVCLEFTDLFITIARAAGIPAREMDGFAYTENTRQRPLSQVQDILHAWPEYYDTQKNAWVMVDPTWGNTTGGIDYFHVLDFDHVVFAIKGADSTSPRSAGGYKYAGDERKKDVNVTFTDVITPADPVLQVQPVFPLHAATGFDIQGKVLIQNNGDRESPKKEITVLASTISPYTQTIMVPPLPPYGRINLPVSFYKEKLLTNKTSTITIRFADTEFKRTIVISPLGLTKVQLLGGSIFGIFTIILFIITYKTWSVYVLRRTRKNSLRGKSEGS
jgi:transglutaminase-like putative cysteine protease